MKLFRELQSQPQTHGIIFSARSFLSPTRIKTSLIYKKLIQDSLAE